MTEPTGPRPRPTTADPAQTVFFGIPLKARATAKNWDWTVRDINRTLASIYNQTNPNFRILVGCHDVPDLLIPTDERLEFIQVDSTTPDLNKEPRSNFPDKELKLRRVSNRFRELGGRWFMPLDADDLVSSQLVQFVLCNPNPNGFIARHGYIFNQESWMMALVPQPKIYPASFDRLAGCTIFRFEEEDFLAANQFGPQSRFDRYISSQDHREFWQMSLQENRPLHPLPFPAFVYVLNTGDNHTFLYGAHRNWLNQELLPKLNAHGSLPNPEVTQEFALSHSVWNRSSSALFKGRHPNEP
ncbi:MAG TPA: glycosyltransferase family A protein, partial [Alphaproteobacteria bacterium]|nr:glycosyltransferase family A protein [Alphaproteobacteria bacterium]